MRRLGCIMLFICLLLTSCRNSKTGDPRVQLKDTYVAEISMKVYGNKASSEYKLLLSCSLPDRIRIETLEPEFLKGKIVTKNVHKWKIEHPLVNEKILATDAFNDTDLLKMGVIGTWMHKSGKQYEDVEKKNTVCIEVDANRGQKGILYFDKKEGRPIKVTIVGTDGKPLEEIIYLKFEYKESLQEKLFTIE